ncbi:Radical SAM superfamily enzyme YgiQ, UPF0313 family [Seinonella peptonophila]|uniref:Radical SAM superfamily enzyme YgiQ, UPF0313 family n=1 Tax=Seinonella peptonophila TaxID=112248 RepID=A0A1M4ZXG9_9BACL|nr:radical SAM protein [Seinonella peptonophila]SHF22750.1 Radical SAM superfamily enzyme YgiQ, UPF0313 family [Seinonella peptonophila]
MYSVTLINLPTSSIRKPAEHSGLASLHAYLTSKGIDASIIDAYANNIDIETCWSLIKRRINSHPQMIVGFTPFVTSVNELVVLGERIKKYYPDVFVIVGGHFATFHKEYLLDEFPWLDAVVVGEGEQSLYEYSTSPSDDTPGVLKRNTPFIPRPRIRNLDTLPYQTRYISPEKLKDEPLSLVTGRGCYAACTFCSIPTFYRNNSGPAQSARSVAHLLGEIKTLINKYQKNSFKIVDDNFFRVTDKNDQFLVDLVAEIKKLDIDLIFRLSARPNDITEKRAKLLKEMGTNVVAIGGESAHEDSLVLFNKRLTVADSRRAANILKENGITTLMNFITFDPILDISGLKLNLEFIKEHMNFCVFHRINSHLWLRSTDPILQKLLELGLVTGDTNSFPYVPYRYKCSEVYLIKKYFDYYCAKNMRDYYAVVETLMAPNELPTPEKWEKYHEFMIQDTSMLEQLIKNCEEGVLEETDVITEELFEDLRLFV